MIRVSTLASSSKGNATVIHGGGTVLMIDTGISATRIRQGLKACQLELSQIEGILYTHEHTDHICGLGVLSKRAPLPLYCSRYLLPDLRSCAPNARFTCLEPGAPVHIGDFTVTPICSSHDAIDPFGYLFECDGTRLGYITDTGRIMREMRDLLRNVDGLLLESNYDPAMLRDSGRPYHLIERINGQWGHLSNEQACDFVRDIAHPGLQALILIHLSQDCNTPGIATRQMQATLDKLGLSTSLHCAPAADRLPWVSIS